MKKRNYLMYRGNMHKILLKNDKEWKLQFKRKKTNEFYSRKYLTRAQNVHQFLSLHRVLDRHNRLKFQTMEECLPNQLFQLLSSSTTLLEITQWNPNTDIKVHSSWAMSQCHRNDLLSHLYFYTYNTNVPSFNMIVTS